MLRLRLSTFSDTQFWPVCYSILIFIFLCLSPLDIPRRTCTREANYPAAGATAASDPGKPSLQDEL